MKKIFTVALTALFFCACGSNEPKSLSGVIVDASMNVVSVKDLANDSVYTFPTENADMTEANGLLIGAPVTVDYTGELPNVKSVIKVAADATYEKAVGKWIMAADSVAADSVSVDSLAGVELMIEGAAASINMATLVYSSWELKGAENEIVLKGQSLGNGQTVDFTENGMISEKDGKLYLSIEGTEVVYEKAGM